VFVCQGCGVERQHWRSICLKCGGKFSVKEEKVRFKVNGNRVLIRPEAQDEKVGSLYLPGTAERTFRWGMVAGAGWMLKGSTAVVVFDPGDKVLFDSLGAQEVELDGEKFLVVRHEDVVGQVTA
jgi:chaperonin GroES